MGSLSLGVAGPEGYTYFSSRLGIIRQARITRCSNVNAIVPVSMTNPTSSFSNVPGYEFVCVEGLRPSQPNGAMPSAVSLPNHTFTGQA